MATLDAEAFEAFVKETVRVLGHFEDTVAEWLRERDWICVPPGDLILKSNDNDNDGGN